MWTPAVIKFVYISYKICLVTKSSVQKNSLRTKHKHLSFSKCYEEKTVTVAHQSMPLNN